MQAKLRANQDVAATGRNDPVILCEPAAALAFRGAADLRFHDNVPLLNSSGHDQAGLGQNGGECVINWTWRARAWHGCARAGVVALCVFAAGCGTPVTVERTDARTINAELTGNALTAGRPSGPTQITLRRLDLLATYREDPVQAIQALHRRATSNPDERDLAYALAELAFLQAERTGDRSYYLASVIYAYAFLFPALAADRPQAFDERLRAAAEFYNLALARGLSTADGAFVDPRAGDYALPFGTLSIALDPYALRWANREVTGFVPAAELRIEGLRNRYREPGIGAALVGEFAVLDTRRGFQVARMLKVPVTVLLRLDITPEAVSSGRYTGRLAVFPGREERAVDIGGQSVPLEIEPSVALASTLSNPSIWQSELAGFFDGNFFDKAPTQLVALEPYRRGRIPVLLIHGTASSAGRWADLINDLQNDPAVRDRFQFWLFTYNTGNPVLISALQLREAIADAVTEIDPDRKDPALRRIVLVGHSQGGLLAKMLVVNTGTQLFDAFSTRPLDELSLSDETREKLRRAAFLEPMPDVGRVIFIATPHRGSFIAGRSIAQIIGRFVTLPLGVTRFAAEMLTGNQDALRLDPRSVQLGSVYGMTPGSPLITALSGMPVAPGIPAHSIIAVDGDGPFEAGNDGVVAYSSARLDEAESELVIRSGHSVQTHPQAVSEIRRILLLHWKQVCAPACWDDAKSAIAGNGPRRAPPTRGTRKALR